MNDKEIIIKVRRDSKFDRGISGIFGYSDMELAMQKARQDEREEIRKIADDMLVQGWMPLRCFHHFIKEIAKQDDEVKT